MRGGHSLRSLHDVRPLYMLPVDSLAEEVLIPAFEKAGTVDCMVGFFSSDVLASLAPGLATYISRSANSFRLIVSPLLRNEDRMAIEQGTRSAAAAAETILEELIVTEDLLQRHTLTCLAWLLRHSRIEIKIAVMKDALFHPKVWLFGDGLDVVAAHGSSNVTVAGIRRNVEQVAVSKSWHDPNQRYITDKLRQQFFRLWENEDDNCLVVAMPEAVRRRLLRTYDSEVAPTEDDLRALYRRAAGIEAADDAYRCVSIRERRFRIPDGLKYKEGPFEHQAKAVHAWCEAGYRGVLEMATGSGKTITSMIGAYRLYETCGRLLIVVAAPYVPLIEQWCDEVTPFGITPVNLTTVGGATRRAAVLQRLNRRLRTGVSDVEVVIVSHDTLCTREFGVSVQGFDCPRLLIADEVHNLGRQSFIEEPPEHFEHRLGLSATPTRQYDEEGTKALVDFFGPVVFQFTLEDAIGCCLVEYDYYIHPVYLTSTEIDEWCELTERIRQQSWRTEGRKPDDFLAKMYAR